MQTQIQFAIPVEVKSDHVDVRSGTSRANKPFTIREQHAWVNLGKAYPQEIRLTLEGDAAPYAPGMYVIDESSLYVDRYGSLQLGRLRLKRPAPAAVQGAGASRAG